MCVAGKFPAFGRKIPDHSFERATRDRLAVVAAHYLGREAVMSLYGQFFGRDGVACQGVLGAATMTAVSWSQFRC